MKNKNISRRNFLKIGGTTVIGLAAGRIFGFSKSAFADATKPLSESDSVAKALCYYQNAAKVDTKRPECAKKAGPDGKTQKCSNCMFFTTLDAKSGKCQIFPNNTVAAEGWCGSWAKKPA